MFQDKSYKVFHSQLQFHTLLSVIKGTKTKSNSAFEAVAGIGTTTCKHLNVSVNQLVPMTLLSRPGRLQLVDFCFLYPTQQRYLSITEDLGGRRDVWSCSEFSWCVKCSQSLRKKQLTSTLQGCCATILFLFCVEKYAKQKMIIYDKPRTSAKLADSMQKSSTTSPQQA